GKHGSASLVAEICVPSMRAGDALLLYYVRPVGVVVGDVYKYPSLPVLYARDAEHGKLGELLVAEDVLFSNEYGTIVRALVPQNSRCQLEDTKRCFQKRFRLSAQSTVAQRLKNKTIVVTKEKSGFYLGPDGSETPFSIPKRIIVHDRKRHRLLKIGGMLIGENVIAE
ncbi:hypothetical protein PFISCL1PPCAC_7783, partial [Pristionchus fissidentatus]